MHGKDLKNIRPPPKPKWSLPRPHHIKINCDASWTSLDVGVAVVARNYKGQVVGGTHFSTTAPSPLYAEALALCSGVFLAHKLLPQHCLAGSFEFESDSLQLVHLIKNSLPSSDWTVVPLIEHIRDRTVALPSYSWSWSSRKANQVADYLACLARRRMCPADWVSHPPSFLSMLLCKDAVSDSP
ncbi:putative ribonuclease H-like domain-containing protein [Rosa chinensis]|uniref:Putative ribonuclease H-like domain-containing protein n=1 Tax=Rosa chinensis TaxID=74649 RepID=A0A2P6SEX8_ROSCH|nr:putative ribonuclease H-like domain-containing protein [Rosa chinensis]